MYFVISVLPISITSGAPPPASVASNFFRWSPHVWYWTSTVTPGCCFSNCAVAASTIGCHFSDCASVCSQTVMLSAAVPPEAVEAIAARAAPTRTTAPIMRALLMGDSPKRVERRCASLLVPLWLAGNGRRTRLLVYTTLPRFGTVAQAPEDVKTTLGSLGRPKFSFKPHVCSPKMKTAQVHVCAVLGQVVLTKSVRYCRRPRFSCVTSLYRSPR